MQYVNPSIRVGGVMIVVVSPKKNGTVVTNKAIVPRKVRG